MPPVDGHTESDLTQACRVCAGSTRLIFSAPVLGREVRYFDCAECGYVQTESPYWLGEAYEQPIGGADTGIMLRNQANVARVATTLLAMKKLRGRVLDVGGGFGILVRMLRDTGIDAYWSDKHCQNLLALGFERDGGKYDLATAFEVVEHLERPVDELRSMLERAPTVLISTDLAPPSSALTPDWWYLAREFGQHIGFLRESTLDRMATELGCHYATDGVSVHLFTRDLAVRNRWARLRRFTRFAPSAARRLLQSRTLTDFEAARARMSVGLSEPSTQNERNERP